MEGTEAWLSAIAWPAVLHMWSIPVHFRRPLSDPTSFEKSFGDTGAIRPDLDAGDMVLVATETFLFVLGCDPQGGLRLEKRRLDDSL